jgi:hypothetical protein
MKNCRKLWKNVTRECRGIMDYGLRVRDWGSYSQLEIGN